MSYTHDPDGNQTKVTNPRGYATTTTYNADDQPTVVTDPDGNSGLTCYDAQGNVAQTVPPAGVASNNLTAASCPTNYPAAYSTRLAPDSANYTYNALGQETSATTPAPAGQSAPQTTTTTYTAAGLPATVTYPPASNAPGAPNGVAAYTYDTDGNVLTVTNGTGTAASTTSYSYDANGNQTAVTNPDGNKTTYSYDSAGRLVSTTTPKTSAAPSGATTTLAYNAAGQLASSTDPDGVTASFTYNTAGLTAGVSYSGSSAHAVTYGYDAEGNLTSTSDATGASSYAYDPFGALTSYTNGAGKTVGYGYDSNGNTTSITYPLPASATWATTKTVAYAYDQADLLTSVTDFTGNKITVGYNSAALPSSQALGSTGDTVTTSYDQTGTPSAIALKTSTTTLLGFSYADAPSGNILSETDTPSSSQTPAAYSYDQLGRVTSYTPGTGASHSYGYDQAYNMTGLPTGASGTYDQAGELTSSALSGLTTNYSYNADGQRLTAVQGSTTTATGSWNGAQQLTGYSDPSAIMTAAAYDGAGLRESATFGGTSQNFTWDPSSSTLLMDSGNAYIYGTSTAPAEQVSLSTGAVTYPVADSLGSVRGIVSSSGSLTASTSYDAWGNPLTPGGLQSYTPFGYAGAYTDPTGLMYLINRYYDPAIGQFLSIDPALSQTGQPYAYADGNPVGLTDPAGMAWEEIVPTGQVFDSQADFSSFLYHLIGGRQGYKLKWGVGTPDWLTDYRNRIIDLYSGGRYSGTLNEIHTGETFSTPFIRTEIARDRYLIRMGRKNTSTASHDGLPFFPQNGTWYFSAKGEDGCQTQQGTWGSCPTARLSTEIKNHKLNIVLFENVSFDSHKEEAEAVGFWRRAKVKVLARKAALSFDCPVHLVAKLDALWKDEFGQVEINPTPHVDCSG